MDDPIAPSSNDSPFHFHLPVAPAVPIVIAAPHGGRRYPQDLLYEMRDPDYSCLRLEDRFIDRIAEQIAEQTGAASLIANAPRAMLDLNRSTSDVDWGMISDAPNPTPARPADYRRARNGLGLIPRRLPGHGDIWRGPISHETLQQRIADIHEPYHAQLASMMQHIADSWGAVLLIDLHSMPPLKSAALGQRAAEFVVGDRFGAACASLISARTLQHFDRHRRPVAHNRPYSGGYILDRHGNPSKSRHALQLEICRDTYLDARHEQPTPRMDSIVQLLSTMVQDLASEVAQLGSGSLQRQAAE